MPHYLFQASYTSEAWARLVKKPQNREPVIRAVVEKLGGTLEGLWVCMGDYDVVALCNLPNDVSAVAFSVAAGAGGALKNAKTTPLFSTDEALKAYTQAGKAGYRPPK